MYVGSVRECDSCEHTMFSSNGSSRQTKHVRIGWGFFASSFYSYGQLWPYMYVISLFTYSHIDLEKKVFFASNLIHFFAHDILAVLIQFFISNGWYWFGQFWKSDKISSGTAVHRVIKSTFGIHCSFRAVQWMWKQEEDCAFPLRNYCSWLFCRLNFTISFGKKRLKNNCAQHRSSRSFSFIFVFLLPS